MTAPVLELRDLGKSYAIPGGLFGRKRIFKAFQQASFTIGAGEAFGLVGESGSGKSTLARVVMQLERESGGEVWFEGERLTGMAPGALQSLRRRFQIVFQDPYAALNPRMRVGDFVAEPLVIHGTSHSAADIRRQTEELFELVGLDAAHLRRYPHEFSGGQRQRISIARAIALRPSLIVADEPITALDVSIQAQIVNLLCKLQNDLGMSYLFISHDLSMVRYLCHRVAVLLEGRIVEMGPTAEVFANPRHPYTRSLLSAAPIPDPERQRGRKPFRFDRAGFDPNFTTPLAEVGPGHLAYLG